MTLFHRILNVCLISILTLQLASVDVHLHIPTNIHGSILQLVSENDTPPRARPQNVRLVSTPETPDSLLFVGDILLARNIEHLMAREGYSYPYRGIDFHDTALRPVVVGNFEAAVPEVHIPTPMRMIDFSVHERFLPNLAGAGFTHLSLANNHSLDFGPVGYKNTKESLQEAGVEWFGHPRELDKQSVRFVTVEEQTVALIAVHTLEKLPNVTEIREVFEYANARSNLQIVYVHWGTEYAMVHNARQRDAAERFIDAGADLIVGHHPHVVQDVDLIDGVPVFYSLGNYIFDQYASQATQEGLLLKIDFTDEPIVAILPVTSVGNLSQPHPMDRADHSRFLTELASRSHSELREHISGGYLPLSLPVATSLKMAMIGGTDKPVSYVQ